MSTPRQVNPIVMHVDDLVPGEARHNPRIKRLMFFSDFAGGHTVGASIATHPKGVACGRHTHRGATEQFLVLEGEGIVEVGDDAHEVRVGSLIVVPPGVVHNVIGMSDQPELQLFYILTVAPGHEADLKPWLPVD